MGWSRCGDTGMIVLQKLLEYSCFFSAKNCLPIFPRKVCKDISAEEIVCTWRMASVHASMRKMKIA